MGKVTMQDVADALNISRVTVCKAFNNQSGVSDALRQSIFEKAQELGYKKVSYKMVEQMQREERTISLIVSRPDSSTFWTNIIHRMAQELSSHNINLMYTYVPSVYTDEFTLPSILSGGIVSGCIVLNVYDPNLLKLISDLPIPKVFLDTVPSLSSSDLNGDLFLIEGGETEYNITSSLIRRGLTNVGFIGDIDYAQTNRDRYFGFLRCMQEHQLEVNPKFCYTESIDIYSYDTQLSRYLSNLEFWPEAFVCVSDYVAHFVQQYLDEQEDTLSVPIILTGFDNSKEYTNVADAITTATVQTGMLGKRLAVQMLFRIDHPDAPYELTYIHPEIVYHNVS